MQYAELECKTNYSFLRGASHPEELIQEAENLGLSALALTDFDGVYGIPKAFWEKKKFPDLKLICGASLSLPQGERLSLLARNRKAYGLLCRILTKSHEGKEKGLAEISWEDFTALIEQEGGTDLYALASASSSLPKLRALFPSDRLYLTLSRFLDGQDSSRTEKALWLSRRWQAPLVATNDVHFHSRGRKRLQDMLTAIRETTPLSRLGHKLFTNQERHLKSPAQMHTLFSDLPQAIENGLLIADACTFCPSELRYRYPTEWIPAGQSAFAYLEGLVWEGSRKRYPQGLPTNVGKQILHELKLIEKLAFADYFLTIFDIMEFARSKRILCQGRGSAANSVVCYCLGITAIDPIQMNLLFERFISEERNEPPDIDVDFESERREEVLQYVYEKYGRHRAAMLSAVVTYRRRSALREITKALGFPIGTLSAKKIEKQFSSLAAEAGFTKDEALVQELAQEMKGFPRHLSIHSGGFTLSADPIIEIVPVEPARMDGRTIIQWDKYDLDYLGLLKVDLLSLGMLSALRRSLDLMGKELHEIPHDDPATYKMIQRTETVGTFQIESRAQMSMLGRLQPKNFYDLVVEVAIVRPGPIVGKMVHPYLRRRQGKEPVHYPHPALRKILGKTLGIPLFQEQVMKMAIELGGFSPGEADELRRAIGAWRSEGSIQKMGEKLIAGLKRSGLSSAYAEQIFLQIQGFAQYGFPESHAASFALLAYASCYIKCHHPAFFTASLLNSQPMGFYAPHTLIDEAKRQGVKILPVHPELSSWDCEVNKDGSLRLGLKVVKGLHHKEALRILEARPFGNLFDFLERTQLRKDILFRLAMSDAFSCFGLEPRAALWQILEWRKPSPIQGELFAHLNPTNPGFSALSPWEKIRQDYGAYSLSHRGHPMEVLRQQYSLPKLNSAQAKKIPSGSRLKIAGLILVRQRPPTAKGMTFSTLEDEFGLLDMAIPPDIWERVRSVFLDNCFLVLEGKMQREGYSTSLLVTNLRPFFKEENFAIEPAQYFH